MKGQVKFFRILTTVTIFVAAIAAHASEPIILDLSPAHLGIGNRWDLELKASGIGNSTGMINKIGSTYAFLVTETGLNLIMELRFRISATKAGLQGEEIAAKCLEAYPQDRWMQISCLSKSIYLTLKRFGIEPGSSPCQSLTYAFESGFNKLQISRAQVGIRGFFDEGEGHVFNRLTFIDSEGNIYAYIVDLLMAPNTIFPLTQPTENFHLKNGRQKLPEFVH